MAQRNTYFQDEVVQKKIDIKQLGRVLKYVLPFGKIFAFVCVLMLCSSVCALASPMVLRFLIDTVAAEQSCRELVLVIAGLAVLAAMEIVLTFVQQRLMGQMGHGMIAKMREDIFYKLQELPFDYFDNRPDGKIVVRVTDYVNELANFFTNYVVMLLVYIVKIVIVTVFMLSISPCLTAIVMLTVVPMMACVFYLRYRVRRRFAWHRAKVSNRTAFIVETIMGEKIIKNYNRIELNKDTYYKLHDESVNVWWGIVLLNNLNTSIVESFWNMGTLFLYGISLSLILGGGAVTAGTVATFTTYMGLFSGPLTEIAFIIQQLALVSSNLEQVFDTIDHEVTICDKEGSIPLRHVKGRVDFEDVTFAYEDNKNILEHFDLHVSPGETIALAGPTGAGKTTIVHMLTRFYDVKAGAVKIDGHDVREVTLKSLREEVGVLMQDPFLFKGTVMENIRYGRPDASDEACIAAAKYIFADQFIEKLPNGYYEELDERGEGLSAGEKQLLSFARIILKNPSVIILDEATSSIDTETENLIQQALDVMLKEKTAFLVAHRLSTIRGADRILYITDKGIAEEGSHSELMAKKGYYYALNADR